MRDAVELAKAFTKDATGVRFRQAVVAALDATAGTVDLTIAGADEVYPGAHYAGSYSPAVGDVVWYVTDGRDLMVAWALAPTGIVPWTAPTFTNSWVNFGGGYRTAGYCKTANGRVHLRGMVKTGTLNTTVFTLPVGCRPTEREVFVVNANGVFGRVDVLADGQVTPMYATSTTYLVLNGISFDTV